MGVPRIRAIGFELTERSDTLNEEPGTKHEERFC
jgi:hypothetical protein